ncbi:MAG: hypothetical protein GC161_10635 [Planctomycetaceae bacterium]|nr:hypothetical protein [Planctomycetaceae bacterium]
MHSIRQFFARSDSLDHEVLRPLSHIRSNWELQLDQTDGRYLEEAQSFAKLLNGLVDELVSVTPTSQYHDSEDRLARYVQQRLSWGIKKKGREWVNANGKRLSRHDYLALLEQGGYKLLGTTILVEAAAGRVQAAISRGQKHFDVMERSHRIILGGVLGAILYHKGSYEG